MKTIETTVYTYDELSDTAKEKALEWVGECVYDIEYWDCIYDDAKSIGLKITSFDVDRSRHAKGAFITSAPEVAEAIITNHGENCESYKTAKAFLAERDEVVNAAPKDENGEFESEHELDNELDAIEAEFLRSLLEDYSIMLQKECDHLSSREYLEDMIHANEYTFTETGKRFG